MKRTYIFLLFLVSFLSCDSSENLVTEPENIRQVNIDMPQHKFGFEMFNKEILKSEPGENVLISPYSIQVALYMLINGLEGDSRSQLVDALHLEDFTDAEINNAYELIYESLHDNKSADFLSNNALFYDEGRVDVFESFKNALTEYYQSEIIIEDFDSPVVAKESINQWIKNNTQEKIDKLIESIKSEDVAFILNAIYFRSDWANGFPLELTSKGLFHHSAEKSSSVDFMHHDAIFNYLVAEDHFILDLPLKDNTFSITFIGTSDEDMSIDSWFVENESMIMESMDQLSEERAFVTLPKMNITYKSSLISSLRELGVNDIFESSRCELSSFGNAISGGALFINQIEHKAKLIVDEKGVEGAAVTSIGVGVTSVPPSLTFNRPFLIILRHVDSSIPIFLGLIKNPIDD